MKSLILSLMLATVVFVQTTQAQQLTLPKTIKLHNNKTGEHLGTVTISGNTAYIRDKDGVHIYTVVQNQDGTKTSFDTHGNVVNPPLNIPGE